MDKLISSEKLIHDLSGIRDTLPDIFLKNVMSAAISCVEKQRAVEKLRWVSVDDRLPEKEATYFVVTKKGAVTFARFYPERDIRDYKGQYLRHDPGSFQSNRNVIFWMPLPEPPKEEN